MASGEFLSHFKIEYFAEPELGDQLVNRRLAVFPGYFRQDELCGMPVVRSSEISLHANELSGLVQCHRLKSVPSFFPTGLFSSRTYSGKPPS